MAAWARFRSSFSSLPTVTSSPSSSPPSSSASLPPLVSLDLADELWFYHSVLPLPSISLPCLPQFAPSRSPTPPPDTSTLIAQCMFDGDPSPFPLLSSSSPRLPPDPEQTEYASWYLPAPCEGADHKENVYPAYNEKPYYGYSSSSDSDDDDNYFRRPYPRLNAGGEDEEAFHYYTAASDLDDEDTYNDYPAPGDWEDEQPPHAMKEELLEYPREPHEYLEPEDALSGIYDVAALLKGQHNEEREYAEEQQVGLAPSRFAQEALSQVSALPHFQVVSGNDQADVKESLKLWAHAVALTLPWKAAVQARSLL